MLHNTHCLFQPYTWSVNLFRLNQYSSSVAYIVTALHILSIYILRLSPGISYRMTVYSELHHLWLHTLMPNISVYFCSHERMSLEALVCRMQADWNFVAERSYMSTTMVIILLFCLCYFVFRMLCSHYSWSLQGICRQFRGKRVYL